MGGSGTHPELSQRRVPRWVHRRVVPGRARVGEIESPLRVHGSRLTLRDRGDENWGSSANRAEIGVAPRRPEPTLGDRGRSLGLAVSSRTLRRGERAALARSCPRRAEVCGAPRRTRSSLNRLGREPSLGRANVFQPAGRRASRSLSRTARWDANETSRGEARSFRSYNHLTFDAC